MPIRHSFFSSAVAHRAPAISPTLFQVWGPAVGTSRSAHGPCTQHVPSKKPRCLTGPPQDSVSPSARQWGTTVSRPISRAGHRALPPAHPGSPCPPAWPADPAWSRAQTRLGRPLRGWDHHNFPLILGGKKPQPKNNPPMRLTDGTFSISVSASTMVSKAFCFR